MPANRAPPPVAAQPPVSPTAKTTAKYTNKDGSKFITVPKMAPLADVASQPSTPTATTRPAIQPTNPANANKGSNGPAPTVNRKKQRRREKAAARAAAEQEANPADGPSSPSEHLESHGSPRSDVAELGDSDDDEPFVLATAPHATMNGSADPSGAPAKGKKSKKKKKKTPAAEPVQSLAPTTQAGAVVRAGGISKEKIWNTSSQEERERIKEFWLGLGEDERKSLVKVEKNAVLKKMKEQQKHTCSCTVCGRKRTAIEEELEGLYDAYYLELEQFANRGETPALLDASGELVPRSGRGVPSSYSGQQPSRGRIVEQLADEDEDAYDEEAESFSDDEFDDEYSDEPEDDDPARLRRDHDFLAFGNSLQVRGGILTVADDILQNDGRRFIEMMENLAERRLKREENSHHVLNGQYTSLHPPAPPDDEEYEEDEEEEEDEYEDSQGDSYEDEQDNLTEEQRMEEGRRMFQIFAARMFEQRVLSAYREKVAKERQEKLLEELDDEELKAQRAKDKKARDAQKRKEKAALKKQQAAEKKARDEEAKKAEEEAKKAELLKKEQENRQKQEEKRKLKEAQRKAEEAEKHRRLHEQREREREAREAKERDKRLKEEQKLKEKEAREQKEKEARERREKQEQDRRDKEARAKVEREAREARERQLKAEKAEQQKAAKAAQKVAAAVAAATASVPTPVLQSAKRAVQPVTVPIPVPAALPQHPTNPTAFASPKIPVATPAIPKAPTPIRSRQASQQQDPSVSSSTSVSGSAASQNPSPHPATPIHSSPGPIGLARGPSNMGSAPILPSQSTPPQNGASRVPSGPQPVPFHIGSGPPNPPPGMSPMPPPGFPNQVPLFGQYGNAFANRPNMMQMGPPPPPGIGPPTNRPFPMHHQPAPPPGFQSPVMEALGLDQGFALPKNGPASSHSRQGSQTFDSPIPSLASIARPGPIGQPNPLATIGQPGPIGQHGLAIGRPSSVVHGNNHRDTNSPFDINDGLNETLGSSALLGDPDDGPSLTRPMVPGVKSTSGHGFPPLAAGFDNNQPSYMSPGMWGAPPRAQPSTFGPPPGLAGPMLGGPTWNPPAYLPNVRHQEPGPIMIRQALARACQYLANSRFGDEEGFVDLDAVRDQERLIINETVSDKNLLDLCDTEGTSNNGGGSFEIRRDVNGVSGRNAIRWVPDAPQRNYRAVGAPGEISSPVIGSGSGFK